MLFFLMLFCVIKSEQRYPPDSDFLKLSEHVTGKTQVQHFPVEATFYFFEFNIPGVIFYCLSVAVEKEPLSTNFRTTHPFT